jgi:PKD repeat protein
MKTITKTIRKNLLRALLLIVGIGCFTMAKAQCSANFIYKLGVNGQASFTSTSTWTGSGAQLFWNPGDGSGSGYGNTYSHTYIANGTYYVALYLNVDSSICTSADTVPVVITNVTTPCTLAASYTYSIGANGVVSFTSTSTGTNSATKYYWDFGDGSGKNLLTSTPTHTYSIQGVYNVWLVIMDTGTAYCADSTMQNINVTTADSNTCGLHAHFTYSIGANGHVTFTNTSTGSTSNMVSTWNPGDASGTTTTTATTYSHIYTSNGTYNVNLLSQIYYNYDTITGYDTVYCSDSLSIPITISNVTVPCTLSANFTAINDTALGEITVISNSTGTNSGTQYYWGQGADSVAVTLGSDTMMFNYTSNGTYYIKLVVKDTGTAFCADSIVLPINISNRDSLHASYTSTYMGDSVGLGYQYNFYSTSTGVNGNTWYLWNPGDTTGADSGIGMTSYNHTYKYPGVHTVTLSIWFASYPKIKPHGTMSYTRYDFSSYSQNIYISSPQGIATIADATSGLSLYPTPNNGQFRMVLNNVSDGSADVEIINVLGETMYKGMMQVSNGKLQQDINLQNAPSGSYFVRVVTAGKVYVGRTAISNR